MSDTPNEDARESEAEAREELGPVIQPDVDETLSHAVKLANLGVHHEVTLFVGGAVITGKLASGRQYFEHLANQIDASRNEINGSIHKFYAEKAERYVKPGEIPDDYVEDEPAYIHLSSASWLNAGQFTTQRGVFWRGRLSKIDGFIFGRASNG